MKIAFVEYDADLLLDPPLLFHMVHSKQGHPAAFLLDQVQNQLEGGGLARAVFPDKAQNTAFGQGKAHMVQGEILVTLYQVLDFQNRFHILTSLSRHGFYFSTSINLDGDASCLLAFI